MDIAAGVLSLLCGLIGAAIHRLGRHEVSAFTYSVAPLVILLGALASFLSLYLAVAVFGLIGLLYWLMAGVVMAFIVSPFVRVLDGLGSIFILIGFPISLWLWFVP